MSRMWVKKKKKDLVNWWYNFVSVKLEDRVWVILGPVYDFNGGDKLSFGYPVSGFLCGEKFVL